MPRGLPRSAGALLVTAVALSAFAVFFGDGSSYDALVWIGTLSILTAASAIVLVLLGLLPFPRLEGGGVAFVALLSWFVLWNAISIVWSVAPDRSWEYFNRGVVYVAFALVGLCVAAVVPRAPRAIALGLLGVFGAALLWALAGKVVPNLYPDGERIARLRAPLDYWNALALLTAMTMPLALWAGARREHARWLRIAAVVLVFVAAVALLLTYSRGGGLIALVTLAVYLVISRDRVDVIGALIVSMPPAIVLGAWAFTQDGLVQDAQPYDRRLDDGLQFGAAFLVLALVVAGLAYLGLEHEERWRPRMAVSISLPRLAVVTALLLLVGVIAVSRGEPISWARDGLREFTNPVSDAAAGPARFGDFSSNSRWTWWEEAWQLFEDDPLGGTGAGSFEMARRPIRVNTTVATEPHNLALQLLSETGLIGFLLAAGAGVGAAFAIVRSIRRLDEGDAAAACALAVLVLAYLGHALVDYDWDFVGVSGPMFLALGVLVGAGRPAVGTLREPFYAAGAVLLALAAVASLAAPWLAERKVSSAYASIGELEPDEAVSSARRARTLNPLAVEPYFAEAAAEELRENDPAAFDLYIRAVELQPRNAVTWFQLGMFEMNAGLREAGIRHLLQSRELDRWGPSYEVLQSLGL